MADRKTAAARAALRTPSGDAARTHREGPRSEPGDGETLIVTCMESFRWPAEAYTALGTCAMAVILTLTLLYARAQVKYARAQVQEAVSLRREQHRPHVVASLTVEQRLLFMLSVENVGNTAAHNVKIDFEEQPRSTLKEIEQLRMLREPIPTMPPGQKFRASWESALDVFSEETPYPHPLSYRVFATYEDVQGHVYGPEPYILDFRVYEGQAQSPKGMTELVQTMEKLVAEHRKWTHGISGLVDSQDVVRARRRQDRPSRFRATRREYERSGWKGAMLYWIEVWRRRYGLWSRP